MHLFNTIFISIEGQLPFVLCFFLCVFISTLKGPGIIINGRSQINGPSFILSLFTCNKSCGGIEQVYIFMVFDVRSKRRKNLTQYSSVWIKPLTILHLWKSYKSIYKPISYKMPPGPESLFWVEVPVRTFWKEEQWWPSFLERDKCVAKKALHLEVNISWIFSATFMMRNLATHCLVVEFPRTNNFPPSAELLVFWRKWKSGTLYHCATSKRTFSNVAFTTSQNLQDLLPSEHINHTLLPTYIHSISKLFDCLYTKCCWIYTI